MAAKVRLCAEAEARGAQRDLVATEMAHTERQADGKAAGFHHDPSWGRTAYDALGGQDLRFADEEHDRVPNPSTQQPKVRRMPPPTRSHITQTPPKQCFTPNPVQRDILQQIVR